MTNDINTSQQPPLSPHRVVPELDLEEMPALTPSPMEPERSNRLKVLAIILFVFLLAVVCAIIGAFVWYQSQLQPISKRDKAVRITIASGTGGTVIADELEEKSLIRSSLAFQLYLRQSGDGGKIHAGTYLISPSLSVAEITDVLVEGKVAQQKITIPPGLRLDQLIAKLEDEGYPKPATEAALAKESRTLLKGIKPADATLEGYIHPETYLLPLDASVDQVIVQATKQFEIELTDKIENGIAKQGLTTHQAVILASIIQKESSSPATQAKIAQVFLKRLNEGLMLGSDVTFLYAAAIKGVRPTTTIDSPYNTRIYTGLPPGPIANFNSSALEAVANPADGDFLFFVAGDNGKVYFSKTNKEHQENVDKYCIELCKL